MEEQRNLFDTQPEPWQLDDQIDRLVARVVFAEAPFGPYDYLIPQELEDRIETGLRVAIPFGRSNRTLQGYCIEIIHAGHPDRQAVSARQLKPVLRIIDPAPIITSDLLRLAVSISDYYVCPLGTVIEAMIPAGVREDAGKRNVLFLSLATELRGRLDELKLTVVQRRILDTLAQGGDDWTPRELAETAGCTTGPIDNLRKKGLIVAASRSVRTRHVVPAESPGASLELNAEQTAALDALQRSIDKQEFVPFLIHGITGSGKTEVYIRAIERVVEYGRQAIVLVPEISLTPQTRQRFRARFDRVAVMHSHLTAAQRAWHWHEIARGGIDVIIGARSAVFAPAPNLGLIVIDEEHDGSFKQENAPRYHAREVAVQRCRQRGIPLVLGSATPALESWQAAVSGRFQLLSLPRRVLDRPLPNVSTIDLNVDYRERKFAGAISLKLRQEMRSALDRGGQIILLLNRRGFSTRIYCLACRKPLYCPDCAIPMTHHLVDHKAVCHYCDFAMPSPSHCECGSPHIRFAGVGTQKLHAEVQRLFPDVTSVRMDTDTMRQPGSHEATLTRFRGGEIQILLGTQMIAKGLDFPNVVLVGVINADTSLHFPDFRAAEKTFGLVTQVAGRSGRGEKGGRVLVQTFSPANSAIVAATKHDYLGFANDELRLREQSGYPPYRRLVRFVVRSESEEKAKEFAQQIARQLEFAAKTLGCPLKVIGVGKANLEKLKGKYRFHVLVRGELDQPLQGVIRRAESQLQPIDDVQWIVDVDPIDMM
jgi:primosomal protein N' (replication factor Y)